MGPASVVYATVDRVSQTRLKGERQHLKCLLTSTCVIQHVPVFTHECACTHTHTHTHAPTHHAYTQKINKGNFSEERKTVLYIENCIYTFISKNEEHW